MSNQIVLTPQIRAKYETIWVQFMAAAVGGVLAKPDEGSISWRSNEDAMSHAASAADLALIEFLRCRYTKEQRRELGVER